MLPDAYRTCQPYPSYPSVPSSRGRNDPSRGRLGTLAGRNEIGVIRCVASVYELWGRKGQSSV